ncbi:MAG: hypothetical protein JWM11_4218 [Planctomycetaceae bacterium]|nr:hypothetical protein [Planctomycetaceae bacterium]
MVPRWNCLSVIVVSVLSCSSLIAQQKDETPTNLRDQAAESFVTLLAQGAFAKATNDFDATMLEVLPADDLKKTWEKVLEDAGAYKRQVGIRRENSGKYEIVTVTCEFAKAKLDARVVFDQDGKISGLFFRPAKPTGTEEIWEGSLKVGFTEIRLAFHLFKQQDGNYAGTMDSRDQGATGIILDGVSVNEDVVRLELKSAKMVFEGKLGKDRQELTGHLKQFGLTLPLTLKRVAKAREPKRPQTPQRPFLYEEREVTYENKKGGVKLAGTLTLPKTQGPFPAVILITGSGAQDRDETILGHKPFLVLADYLTRRGIAALRVDDRGVGGSTGNVQDATSDDFADDVRAGVEFLKGLKEIDVARIGLVGHSEGGNIAPLVASQSQDIAFIVLLAGCGLPGEEILYLQGAALLKVAGADAATLARQKELQERMFAVLHEEKDKAAAETKIRAALKDLSSKPGQGDEKQMLEMLPLLDGQIQMVLTPWFRHFLDYDPRPALRKVTCPVLALNGEKDLQVDAAANLKAIEAALKEGGNRHVTIQTLPNLNHLFQSCKTGSLSEYGAIEETFAPAALETIAKWILERTAGQSKP